MSHSSRTSVDQLLRHHAWMQSLARALVRDDAESDDAVQDVWVRALEHPPREARAARGWLRTVLRSVVTDRARSASRRVRREAAGAIPETRRQATPADVLVRAELHRRVVDAVFALPTNHRRVLLLRYYDDLPPREIGRLLGIPAESARKRVQRALAELRDELDRRHGGDRLEWLGALAPLVASPDPSSGGTLVGKGTAVAVKTKAAVGMGVLALLLLLLVAGEALRPVGSDGGGGAADMAQADQAGARAPLADEATDDARDGRADGVRRESRRTRRSRGAGDRRTTTGSAAGGAPDPRTPAARPGVVAGIVREASGRRLAGAVVRIEIVGASTNGGDEFTTPRETTSDTEGRFEFPDLPDRDALVSVTSLGRVPIRRVVRVGGDPLELALYDPATLTGTVRNSVTGEPVAKLLVFLKVDTSSFVSKATAVLAKDGSFRFDGLEPGTYRVQVGERFASARSTELDYVSFESDPVEVPGPALEISLEPGAVITGTLLDELGRPVQGVVRLDAYAVSAHGDRIADSWVRRMSGPDGRFRLQGLLRHPYTITFTPLGATADAETSADASAPSADDDPLGRAGATTLDGVQPGTHGLEVRLPRAGHIVGRLVDPDGRAVTRSENDRRGWLQIVSGAGRQLVWVDVAADGTFRSPPLDAGVSYDLRAGAFPGYAVAFLRNVVPGPDEVRVVLRPASRIRGRVVDGEGRPAPSGVPVHALAVGVKYDGRDGVLGHGLTDHEGRFELDGLGPYRFRLLAGGGGSSFVPSGSAPTARHGAEGVVVRVAPGVAFSGRLLDAEGKGVLAPYLSVRSRAEPLTAATTAIRADDGHFAVHGAPRGKVSVSVVIGGTSIELGEFDAPAAEVEIRLPAR